jgi:uncharacterized membrane protein
MELTSGTTKKNSITRRGSPPSALNPQEELVKLWAWVSSALAFVSFLLVLATLLTPLRLPGKPGWPEAVLVIMTALATLASLTRQLPGQNVLLAGAIIGIVGGILHSVGAATAIPFGPFTYTNGAGPRIFGVLAWPIPALWIIAILNSRGVARLILRPWRKIRTYGFWLIGITTVLTVLFDATLEPFATRVKHFWIWQPTKFPFTWHGVPLVNFLGWLLTALLILAFATPALINKQPRQTKSRPDYHPFVLWLSALALFAVGAATHQLWTATAFCVLIGIAVTVFAIRGAKW